MNDQKRVLSPEQALRARADYLIVGRPILAAPSRQKAAQVIYARMTEGPSAASSLSV